MSGIDYRSVQLSRQGTHFQASGTAWHLSQGQQVRSLCGRTDEPGVTRIARLVTCHACLEQLLIRGYRPKLEAKR